MKVSPFQGNFTTGEISEMSQGRVDLDRYKAALTTCLNMVPTVQGGLTRRPGTKFIEEVKDSTKKTRLVPFKFSATDAFILEFGEEYIRFYTEYGQVLDGSGNPYEIVTPYQESEVFELKFNQSADVIYITHQNYKPRTLSRYASNVWVLTKMTLSKGPFSSAVLPPAITASATTGSITLTAVETWSTTITSIGNNAGRFELTIPSTPTFMQYTKLRTTDFGATMPAGAVGDFDVEWVSSSKIVLLGTAYSAPTYTTGTAIVGPQVFTADSVDRYIKLFSGTGFGNIARITGVTHGYLASAQVEETLAATAVTGYMDSFYDGNGPVASCFFEDRLFFAGNPQEPQRIDGSRTGDYENFRTTDAGTEDVTASHAVSFTLNSNDINAIKWLFSDEKGLIAGTLSNEWVVKSASSQEAISPTSISAKPVSAIGSSDCHPVQTNKAVLFPQKSGRKLREFHYFYDVDGFRATDLSVLAEHITLSGIKQLAYQKDPHQIVWAVKENGGLCALTYDRDVDNLRAGWHRHDLSGTHAVESVAVIPDPTGVRDDVWFIVKRTVNGTDKRFIEYMGKYFDDEDGQAEAYYVDCGLTLENPSNTPLTSVTGLDHLNGESVKVMADGVFLGNKTVSAGAISVSTSAAVIHVGLHSVARGQLPRLDAGSRDGTSIGKTRRINNVGFMVHRSSAFKIGPNFADMTRIKMRTPSMIMGDAVPLFSGIIHETVEFDYDFENQIAWEQDQPLPLTILAVFPQMTTQDR